MARFKLHEDKLEEFKRLSAECMEIGRTKDTGTLPCDIFINDDPSECILLERYRDSEALIEPGAHIGGDLAEAFLATGSVSANSVGIERGAQSEDGRQRGPPSLHALPVNVDTARRLWPRSARAVRLGDEGRVTSTRKPETVTGGTEWEPAVRA